MSCYDNYKTFRDMVMSLPEYFFLSEYTEYSHATILNYFPTIKDTFFHTFYQIRIFRKI